MLYGKGGINLSGKVILEVNNLEKNFPYEKSFFGKVKKSLKAVDKITLKVNEGETLAIVGESGCGKSTLARTIIGLHKKDNGTIIIDGINRDSYRKSDIKNKSSFIQMIFQDPYSSLNPSMKIRDIISQAMLYHGFVTKSDMERESIRLLKLCGLDETVLDRYAKEFSGGQRQRIAIARALSLNPKIIIADEAVSALDVSMQAQIINLMIRLQKKIGMAYIFISHDLNLVKYIATRVGVMYLGEIVEIGDKTKIYKNPMHPYTKALMQSVPISHPSQRGQRKLLKGELPSVVDSIKGCKFRTRCPYAKEVCMLKKPELKKYEENHFVACHFAKKLIINID
jgi:oligopeptide/dipeptide ABC transporter ATP-binding protein